MPHRRTFPCGHRGLGQYCHLCRDIELKRKQSEEKKLARKERADQIGSHVKKLSSHILDKAATALSQLNENNVKDLTVKTVAQEYTSVALNRNYRLVLDSRGESKGVMNHRRYDKLLRKARRKKEKAA